MIQFKTAINTLLVIISTISSTANADNFTIGVEDIDYYPIYQYANGHYSGAASEILNKFAKLNHHTLTYQAYPVTRLNKNYLKGTVDFRFPDNPYWIQDQKAGYDIKYSASVIDFIDGVMVTPSNKSQGINHLKKLGTVSGFTAWDYLSLIKEGKIDIKETNNLHSLIKLTSIHRYDGAYFNIDVARYYLQNTLKMPDLLIFDPELPHTKSSYSLSSFKHPEVIEQFNQFLIEQAEWIRKIKEKYQIR